MWLDEAIAVYLRLKDRSNLTPQEQKAFEAAQAIMDNHAVKTIAKLGKRAA